MCVEGEDVGDKFSPYKLTPEIAIRFNGDIGDSLSRTLAKLENAFSQDFKTLSQGFARKLIRTYYSMVMARSQIWTTRLHEQAEVFLQYFPNKEAIVHTLLKWIDTPPSHRESVYKVFKKEGEWASKNFTREATISSAP